MGRVLRFAAVENGQSAAEIPLHSTAGRAEGLAYMLPTGSVQEEGASMAAGSPLLQGQMSFVY